MTKSDSRQASHKDLQSKIHPPRQQRSERSLEQMLLAGRAMLEERGNLDELSIGDLTRQAGTSVGAFYRRFENKEAFFAVVQTMVLEQAIDVVRQSLATDPVWRDGPPEAIGDRIVELYLRGFRRNQGIYHASLLRVPGKEELWDPVKRSNVTVLDMVVPPLTAHLPPRPGIDWDFEVRSALQCIVGMLVNIVLHDPGPLRLKDRRLLGYLQRQFRRSLGLRDA